jgi:hypothetical protein
MKLLVVIRLRGLPTSSGFHVAVIIHVDPIRRCITGLSPLCGILLLVANSRSARTSGAELFGLRSLGLFACWIPGCSNCKSR